MNSNRIIKLLDWAYDKSMNGIPGGMPSEQLSKEYLDKNNNNAEAAANNLINWQISKCATSGFVTGLGGIITLPVAIPANISSVLYVQMRMIAAIAYMGGYNIRDDSVKSLVYICMTGNSAGDVLKDIGIKIGTKLTQNAINKISFTTIKKINQVVGTRLITKFGQTGIVNLGKAIPFVGGIIGGGMDATSTKIIGTVSKKMFILN